MNYQLLGENIQRIRKMKKMKQQELADAIGINLQSLSKIERGVNYPTFETLEKIMTVLDTTPNELLTGAWKNIYPMEKEISEFLKQEERLNVELAHGQYDNFFDSEEEWLEYELDKLREYITDYINDKERKVSDLYPIKALVQHLKFQKLIDRYDDLYSVDMFGESLEGHKHMNPYTEYDGGQVISYTPTAEDREILSKPPKIHHKKAKENDIVKIS